MIIVSILLPPRAAFAYAGLVTLLFGVVVASDYVHLGFGTDLSPIIGVSRQHNLPYVAGVFLAFASAVCLATWMAAGIARRLHERTTVCQQTAWSLQDRTQELGALNAQLRQADRARADFAGGDARIAGTAGGGAEPAGRDPGWLCAGPGQAARAVGARQCPRVGIVGLRSMAGGCG